MIIIPSAHSARNFCDGLGGVAVLLRIGRAALIANPRLELTDWCGLVCKMLGFWCRKGKLKV